MTSYNVYRGGEEPKLGDYVRFCPSHRQQTFNDCGVVVECGIFRQCVRVRYNDGIVGVLQASNFELIAASP